MSELQKLLDIKKGYLHTARAFRIKQQLQNEN